jgi:hypothetical protein
MPENREQREQKRNETVQQEAPTKQVLIKVLSPITYSHSYSQYFSWISFLLSLIKKSIIYQFVQEKDLTSSNITLNLLLHSVSN